VTVTGGPDDFRGHFGIYSLDGDTLKLCMGDGKMGRPTKFAGRDGDKRFVNLVLKREAIRPDTELIQGTWRGVAAEVSGEPLPKEAIDMLKPTITFTADKMVGKPKGSLPKPFLDLAVSKGLLTKEAAELVEKGAEGVYHLDPAKSPREIDLTILGAAHKTALGIYRLDGDTLTVCVSLDPTKVSERPKMFSSKGGPMRAVWTLKRLVPGAADRAAAEHVLSIGGSVRVDDQEKEIKAVAELPKDPFRLTHVVLTGNRKVTDAGLSVFQDCADLILLYLGKTAVTDAGLAHFRGCWNLNDLELEDTQVTDAGLAHFKNCPALRHLDLDSCTHVTDAGLAHFKGCKKLRDLYLFDTGVTDAGLAPFADCASLEIVGFGETRVGDAGLAHLKDCKRLTHLMINSSQLTDRGLEVVAGYKDLTTLTVQATRVTDAGLKQLVGLSKLEVLDLKSTKVTAAGVAELANALPKCRIEWDGGAVGPPPKGK
jgi:uncharacterized protein (TIGR03067 family)